MRVLPRAFPQFRVRRRIAWAMAIAVLLAGVAQAGHYHENARGMFSGRDVRCLLCIYAGGTAAPPVLPAVPSAPPLYRDYLAPHSTPHPQTLFAASYDARGPPEV